MSRVGKYPVAVPAGVSVALADGVLSAKGKLGALSMRADGRRRGDGRGQRGRGRRRAATTPAGAHDVGHHARAGGQHGQGRLEGFTQDDGDPGHRLPRRGAGQEPGDQPRLLARRGLSGAGRHHDHHAAADRDHRRRDRTSARSARSPPRSARSARPSRTRARACGTRTSRSGARKARRSKMSALQELRDRRRQRLRYQLAAEVGRASAAVRVPVRQAHLRPGHRRRAGPHARRRVEPREGAARGR